MNQEPIISTGQSTQSKIVATPVSTIDRVTFLPSLFPGHYLGVELGTYAWLDKLCTEYKGGCWEFFWLSNSGGFLAPMADIKYRIVWSDNLFDNLVGREAAGIIATLYALNGLAEKHSCEKLLERYEQLREYAMEHPESESIHNAID